jgi:hypothetical protein
MLESQIGKVSKTVQDLTLETLRDQTLTYFQYGVFPSQRERTADMRHLATLEIELCLGKRLFVLAHPRDFDPLLRADALAGLIMFHSLAAIGIVLEGKARDDALYALIYGLHRWETERRPGVITVHTQTWDFSQLPTIIEQGKELVQRGWVTRPNLHGEVDIQSVKDSFVNNAPPTHRSTYKDADKLRSFLLSHVVRSLAEGKTPQAVTEDLVQMGLSFQTARAVVAQANVVKKAAFRQAGCQIFAVGIVLVILGLVITAISYLLAAPGGTYIITTGLFFVGVVNIVRGIVRMVAGYRIDQ